MNRWLAALVLVGAGCGPSRPLPELPAVDVAGMEAPVRDAINPALNAARVKPKDADSVAQLGRLLHAHNQLAAAARTYERAAALEPGNAEYSYLWGAALAADGRPGEATAPLRAALSVPGARLRLGDALYSAGKPAEARKEFEAVLATDANNAQAYYGLGRCVEGTEAIAAFRRALQLFPRYGAARFALAGVYRQQGKRAEAEELLKDYERDKLITPPVHDPAMAAVLALDASANGLLRAAQALDRRGRFAEAVALLERALATNPRRTQAWVNLISLYGRTNQPDKAESAYRQAISQEPRNADAHYNYGVLCARAERFKEARMAFEAAVELSPNHAEALDNLGAVIETSGEWESAATHYKRAIAANPGLRLAHYHLGRILVNQRHLREAIAAFEKAIEPVDDQTAGYLYALGATHVRAGNRAKGIEYLRRAQDEATRFQQREIAASIGRDLAKLR